MYLLTTSIIFIKNVLNYFVQNIFGNFAIELASARVCSTAAAEPRAPNSERTDELHHQLVEQTTTK